MFIYRLGKNRNDEDMIAQARSRTNSAFVMLGSACVVRYRTLLFCLSRRNTTNVVRSHRWKESRPPSGICAYTRWRPGAFLAGGERTIHGQNLALGRWFVNFSETRGVEERAGRTSRYWALQAPAAGLSSQSKPRHGCEGGGARPGMARTSN